MGSLGCWLLRGLAPHWLCGGAVGAGSGRGGAGGRANSTITAFGVQLFRDIRRAFAVSEETFLASLGERERGRLMEIDRER